MAEEMVRKEICEIIQDFREDLDLVILAEERVIKSLKKAVEFCSRSKLDVESLLLSEMLTDYMKVDTTHRKLRNKIKEYLEIRGYYEPF